MHVYLSYLLFSIDNEKILKWNYSFVKQAIVIII